MGARSRWEEILTSLMKTPTTQAFTKRALAHMNRHLYCHGCYTMGEMKPLWIDAMGKYVYRCHSCGVNISVYYMREQIA